MDTLYWLGEYGKVLCAFLFLMFLWPTVVFGKCLTRKGGTYCFSFCVTVQVILITAVVLLLGVLHILYHWLVILLFYGTFVASILLRIRKETWEKHVRAIKRALVGTYRPKPLFGDLLRWAGVQVRRILQRLWRALKPHLVEHVVLGLLVVFGVLYFSYGAFQNYGYGAGDMYVHHQWIDELLDGNIFYAGIYPKGMHCFIYCLRVLFGIELYSSIQLLPGILVSITLIAAYLFLRSIFRWRYTPLFVLALFLTLGVASVNEVYGMSRLQWALPQEFGMPTEFLSALFLVRYLDSPKDAIFEKFAVGQRLIINRDLLMFMASITAAAMVHFYCTIIALLLCLPFLIFNIRKLFNLRRFLSLVLALSLSLGLVVLPMVVAYAAGIPLGGSLTWALEVMREGEEVEDGSHILTADDAGDAPSFGERLEGIGEVLYWRGYVELYQRNRADFLIAMTVLALMLWIGYRIIWLLPHLQPNSQELEISFGNYLPVIAGSVLFMFVYVSSYLGLPQLIAGTRVCSIENLLLLAVVVMPIDMLFALLEQVCRETVLQIASVVSVFGIYLLAMLTGSYHGFLYNELSRYNAEVVVAENITNSFPANSFTIVATTNALYQVNRYGRHEELLRFVQEIDKDEYSLPTEYVFLFVEKRPLEYGQAHFYSGPDWLGNEEYQSYYGTRSSLGSEVNASAISPAEAQKDVGHFDNSFDAYTDLQSRTVLESKAYLWCQNFMRLFPHEMGVYYEDEDFVCYYFRQNPESPYNLAIENWDALAEVAWDVESEDLDKVEFAAVGGQV